MLEWRYRYFKYYPAPSWWLNLDFRPACVSMIPPKSISLRNCFLHRHPSHCLAQSRFLVQRIHGLLPKERRKSPHLNFPATLPEDILCSEANISQIDLAKRAGDGNVESKGKIYIGGSQKGKVPCWKTVVVNGRGRTSQDDNKVYPRLGK